ncbi:MAG: basic secretory protein-like protein [Bacteroidota bacterium]
MISNLKLAGLVLLLSASATPLLAQDDWERIDSSKVISADTLTNDGYTLVFVNLQKDFSEVTAKRLKETFFIVYPQEVEKYNPRSSKKVVFVIDPAYTGVAAASGKTVRFNPEWFVKNPEDIDVVTHECMHIVQQYKDFEPGWITEGIADYVRATIGINNKAGNWTMPDVKPEQSYKNAYRVTARFFVWIEKNKKPGLVADLNEAMRKGKYTEKFWKKQTGLTVDELWNEYSKNPAL